jgi:hypothetical protein
VPKRREAANRNSANRSIRRKKTVEAPSAIPDAAQKKLRAAVSLLGDNKKSSVFSANRWITTNATLIMQRSQ